MPTVRRATLADGDVIVAFNQRLALETEGKALDPDRLRAGVAAALADPAGRGPYFLAEDDSGAVVGQAAVTVEWSDWRNGWWWWLQSVYVRSDARGRGVFRAIHEHIERLARADPTVLGLRLYVENDNRSAQETYRRLGFRTAGYALLEKYPL